MSNFNFIEFLRSFRIGPFAVFDFAVSYLVIYLIWPFLTRHGLPLSRTQAMWLVLPVSVVVHVLVGQITPLTEMVLDPHGHYLVKLLMIFMIGMAIYSRSR